MGWLFTKKNTVTTVNSFNTRAALGALNALIATNTGNVRSNNEDAALIACATSEKELRRKGCLLLLADGMGGHNSGEVASSTALDAFTTAYYSSRGNVSASLREAVKKANETVFNKSFTSPEYNGMGTTLTAVAIMGNSLYLAHVGDSRAYLFTRDSFRRLSKDHTVVQQLIDMGAIPEAAAATHPERNVLLSALGTKAHLQADVMKLDEHLTDDNLLLLCSDGLYDMVQEQEIFSIIRQTFSIDEMASMLIDRACANGGYDNITVLIAAKSPAYSMRRLKTTGDADIASLNENLQQ
jgi:protein phosphatase